MAKFDLKTALNLLPVTKDDETSILQLIDGIDYYQAELEQASHSKLVTFVLKNRLSRSAKLKLKSTYDSVDALIKDMKALLLPKKSAVAIQRRLLNFRQNDLPINEYGNQISEMFVDLTISQSDGDDSNYRAMYALNEKQAIKSFADGLRNRRLSTIIAARNHSSLQDAIQAAIDEEVSQPSTSGDVMAIKNYDNNSNFQYFRGRGRRFVNRRGYTYDANQSRQLDQRTNMQEYSAPRGRQGQQNWRGTRSFYRGRGQRLSNHHCTVSRRILWVAATALATWGAVDVSLGQLQRYNESPTVVTLEKDFRSWRFSVPAITMCYKNRLNKAKLPAAIKKYFNTESSDEKYDYYARLVEAITDSDLFHLQRFQEFNHLDTSVNMFGIAVDVMPEPDIKTRSSQEVTYKWIPVMTEAGACYVTNSLALGDVAIVTPNVNDTARWPETCKYSSLSCYIVMDVPASADFYVHSPYDVMDLTHSPSHVRLTLVRTTELSVMESRCGRGVEELQPTRRGCSYTNEPGSSGRKVHSTNTCRLSCRSILVKKFCNCVPFYYFYDDGPQCTPKGMACLSNYSHKLSNNNGQKCACAPQCIDSIYKEISTVDQIWDRPPFNVHGSIKFAVQAPRTRYTREIVFHFQDLVVSFGGAAGLFLGASFISFVEILYFLLARPFRTTVRREEKKLINKTTAVLKVKQLPVSHETLRINQLTAILDAQKKYDAVPEYYY